MFNFLISFINFLYKKMLFFKESGVGNLDFFTDSEPPKIGKLPTPQPWLSYVMSQVWRDARKINQSSLCRFFKRC